MGKSPGHRKMPDHKVEEQRLRERMQVELEGRVIADSEDVILVREDENPDRYYFPRSDISMDLMERSTSTSKCPFKGEAHYYSLNAGRQAARRRGLDVRGPLRGTLGAQGSRGVL
jgi:uncharacterized protein (DUF427 family)